MKFLYESITGKFRISGQLLSCVTTHGHDQDRVQGDQDDHT